MVNDRDQKATVREPARIASMPLDKLPTLASSQQDVAPLAQPATRLVSQSQPAPKPLPRAAKPERGLEVAARLAELSPRPERQQPPAQKREPESVEKVARAPHPTGSDDPPPVHPKAKPPAAVEVVAETVAKKSPPLPPEPKNDLLDVDRVMASLPSYRPRSQTAAAKPAPQQPAPKRAPAPQPVPPQVAQAAQPVAAAVPHQQERSQPAVKIATAEPPRAVLDLDRMPRESRWNRPVKPASLVAPVEKKTPAEPRSAAAPRVVPAQVVPAQGMSRPAEAGLASRKPSPPTSMKFVDVKPIATSSVDFKSDSQVKPASFVAPVEQERTKSPPKRNERTQFSARFVPVDG